MSIKESLKQTHQLMCNMISELTEKVCQVIANLDGNKEEDKEKIIHMVGVNQKLTSSFNRLCRLFTVIDSPNKSDKTKIAKEIAGLKIKTKGERKIVDKILASV